MAKLPEPEVQATTEAASLVMAPSLMWYKHNPRYSLGGRETLELCFDSLIPSLQRSVVHNL